MEFDQILIARDGTPLRRVAVSTAQVVTDESCPIYVHNRTHAPETDKGFSSRYWDIPTSPLYPFGYGLSYTTFAYSNLRLSQPAARVGETVEVTVEVENTGTRPGEEAAQLYVHQRAGSASRPGAALRRTRRRRPRT
jgi:beta-glucosidase